MLLLTLLRHNPSHMLPLAIDRRKSPDLRGGPTILLALGVRDDDVAVAFGEPVLLEEVVFDLGDFDVPGYP